MFVIETPYLNLDQIYNSGQCPRWIKFKDSKYVIPFKDKALKVEQQRDKYDWTKYRLIMSCSEEDFYNIWFNYFDLKTDYFELNLKAKRLGGKFKRIANRGHGIHILNQDSFEAYILSKVATDFGIKRAGKVINHIAEVCGAEHNQSMRELGRITWYEFPTPEMILENFDKLKKMGSVNNWLKKLCEDTINKKVDITKFDNELFKLFGLHDMNAFPLADIEETIAKNFDCDPKEFSDWFLCDFEYKGLIYMYVLHHIMNPS